LEKKIDPRGGKPHGGGNRDKGISAVFSRGDRRGGGKVQSGAGAVFLTPRSNDLRPRKRGA